MEVNVSMFKYFEDLNKLLEMRYRKENIGNCLQKKTVDELSMFIFSVLSRTGLKHALSPVIDTNARLINCKHKNLAPTKVFDRLI
jgi:F420-0:gamma-glutamyl ligase-like protein